MTHDANPLIDLGLERVVLGHMLRYPAGLGFYTEAGLSRECFYRGVHGFIWEAIQAVDARGEQPDLVTVWQELKRKQVDDAVGYAYYSALIDGLPAPDLPNATALTLRLTELAAMRTLRIAAQVLEKDVTENPDALSNGVVSRHLATIEAVLNTGAERRAHKGAAGQMAALRDDLQLDKQGKVWFGFPQLDEILGGVRRGEVCAIMARPGIGKTLILAHLARVTAEYELPHVFFSLEMPTAQIVKRLARAVYNLGKYEIDDAIEHGRIDDAAYVQVFRDLVIVDTAGLSLSEMASRLRTIQTGMFKDRPIRLVTIDHLGLIGGDRRMNTYDRVSVQSRECKDLAKRLHASVMLAVQVSRDAGGDGSKELTLGSARDSGVVEEAMDYIVGFRRLDKSITLPQVDRERYRDCLFAKVIKNRHDSEGGEIGIRLDGRSLRMTEDRFLQADQNDLARIASGGRR